MVVLQMYIRCLQKLTAINFLHLLLNEALKDLPRGRKNTKWVLKDHPLFNCISRIVKCRLKIYWVKSAKGHIIAFNILNIGRLKLCAAAVGGSKMALTITIEYAKTREQFKTAIANFGAIKYKLAEMAIRMLAKALCTVPQMDR